MEPIINFYESNEKKLLDYDKNTINELYQIIIEEKNNLNYKIWFNRGSQIIKECVKTFSTMNPNYINYIDLYISELKKSIPSDIMIFSLQSKELDLIKKVNLYIKMLEYIKLLNYSDRVFFDKDKYNVIIDTYNMFNNLNNITECMVEWYSNDYIIFYSNSNDNSKICIYQLDDLFGYKLFLTFAKNNITCEIIIYTCDVVINTKEDFYKKIKMFENWKLSNSPIKKNTQQLINIDQIAECFSKKESADLKILFLESNFVQSDKMLQYVSDFLNN